MYEIIDYFIVYQHWHSGCKQLFQNKLSIDLASAFVSFAWTWTRGCVMKIPARWVLVDILWLRQHDMPQPILPLFATVFAWGWLVVGGSLRCMDEQINQMDTPCFLVHHYARGSVTTMIRTVITQTIKSPTECKNEGMIAFENIEY